MVDFLSIVVSGLVSLVVSLLVFEFKFSKQKERERQREVEHWYNEVLGKVRRIELFLADKEYVEVPKKPFQNGDKELARSNDWIDELEHLNSHSPPEAHPDVNFHLNQLIYYYKTFPNFPEHYEEPYNLFDLSDAINPHIEALRKEITRVSDRMKERDLDSDQED